MRFLIFDWSKYYLIKTNFFCLFFPSSSAMILLNKCVKCSCSESTRWHPITDELRDHFCFKELRDSTSVCHPCFMKWYMQTHEVNLAP